MHTRSKCTKLLFLKIKILHQLFHTPLNVHLRINFFFVIQLVYTS